MLRAAILQSLAKEHATPLFVMDHDLLRRNYAESKRVSRCVQAYYRLKSGQPLVGFGLA